MNYRFLLQRLKYLLINPVKAWEDIYSEKSSIKDARDSYFFPIIILIALAALIGSLLFANSELKIAFSLFTGIKYFLLFYLVIYATAYIFKEITYALDLGRDFTLSFKIITYSLTPFFICQILSLIFESFIFINILSLYGLYIFWTGSEKMLNPPEYKKMPLLIATFITFTGVFIAANILLTMISDKLYFAFFA
jgi:hypothetical protein